MGPPLHLPCRCGPCKGRSCLSAPSKSPPVSVPLTPCPGPRITSRPPPPPRPLRPPGPRETPSPAHRLPKPQSPARGRGGLVASGRGGRAGALAAAARGGRWPGGARGTAGCLDPGSYRPRAAASEEVGDPALRHSKTCVCAVSGCFRAVFYKLRPIRAAPSGQAHWVEMDAPAHASWLQGPEASRTYADSALLGPYRGTDRGVEKWTRQAHAH